MHIPVLLKEVLDILEPASGQVIIDATVGEGGHGIPIARALSPQGVFVGVDWDARRIAKLKEKLAAEPVELAKLVLAVDNYTSLPALLERYQIELADGLLVDLGFSSDQLGEGRGFSFRGDEEPLLMTYSEGSTPLHSALRELNAKDIESVIKDLSDERYARGISRAIVEAEEEKAIKTNRQLAEVIERAVPERYERGRIHPATRTFMALRMYINREVENLGVVLGQLEMILKSGGVAVFIAYHSKEDDMIKSAFKRLEKTGRGRLVNGRAITPSQEEINRNPRSRSAKLRALKLN